MFQDVEFEHWKGGLGELFKIGDIVALFTALQRNIFSILLFHRALDALVDEALRETMIHSSMLSVLTVTVLLLLVQHLLCALPRQKLKTINNFLFAFAVH